MVVNKLHALQIVSRWLCLAGCTNLLRCQIKAPNALQLFLFQLARNLPIMTSYTSAQALQYASRYVDLLAQMLWACKVQPTFNPVAGLV